MTGNEKRRPAGDGAALNEQVGAGSLPSLPDPTDTARCRRCGHPISAPTSLARGVGPDCWGRALAALRAAAGGEWHARLDLDAAGRLVRLTLEPAEADR